MRKTIGKAIELIVNFIAFLLNRHRKKAMSIPKRIAAKTKNRGVFKNWQRTGFWL